MHPVLHLICAAVLALWDGLLFILSPKSWPFSWHCRLLFTYARHYCICRDKPIVPSTVDHITLFQPSTYKTTTSAGEIDMFGHKSNATYFTDLDIARASHLFSILREGMRSFEIESNNMLAHEMTEKVRDVERGRGISSSGLLRFGMGGVSCNFKKEIKPGQRYEVWTRVCSWDEKWVYIISHFVSRRGRAAEGGRPRSDSVTPLLDEKDPTAPVIHAVALSKFVFKEGRRTLRPREFFQRCRLIPEDGMVSPEDIALKNAIEMKRHKGVKMAQNMAALEEGFSFFETNQSRYY
ncbi:hypothetical protein ASPWEDRAFT_115453 [Aspergillus wentii DTO 134E9]|uniref:Thioesterase domain-containing protein n=1 Tax=Aspergillus wentii DTO 134E9 TaxID=1073089 RepID=A0A1L9RF73_ASPWE|nr:uncharacterized protein ASPWEDRAFT_115453 [Aspergillus wentii DTO 134E9]OJJ33581.1 hypothetical protein ASPWEDRAFT_115453 [Aspergillus wentii DTO 134E9]